MTPADFRRIALSLPDAEESSHMGAADFRLGGRIFATLAAEAKGYGNLMLTPAQQADFVAEAPELFLPVAGGWGRMGITPHPPRPGHRTHPHRRAPDRLQPASPEERPPQTRPQAKPLNACSYTHQLPPASKRHAHPAATSSPPPPPQPPASPPAPPWPVPPKAKPPPNTAAAEHDHSASNPGQTNTPLVQINPSSNMPPPTDHGSVGPHLALVRSHPSPRAGRRLDPPGHRARTPPLERPRRRQHAAHQRPRSASSTGTSPTSGPSCSQAAHASRSSRPTAPCS